MKKFEPHYRLVRYGQATKIEKASRQQREFYRERYRGWQRGMGRKRWKTATIMMDIFSDNALSSIDTDDALSYRQAEKEPLQGVPRNCQDQGRQQGQEEINGSQRGCWCNGFGYALLACCIWCSVLYLHDSVWEKHRLGVDDAEGVVTSRTSRANEILSPTQRLSICCETCTTLSRASCTRQRFDDKSLNDNPDTPLEDCLPSRITSSGKVVISRVLVQRPPFPRKIRRAIQRSPPSSRPAAPTAMRFDNGCAPRSRILLW